MKNLFFDKLFKKELKIFLILIIAFVLRLLSLNQSFWLDEATSALTVRNFSYTQIINEFSPGDFHPPLYYLTLKFWSGIFGYGEVALRSLSVVFGLASVYLIYLVGKVFSRKAGLLSALFLAVNGLHIYYSQEARMYSMSVFLVSLLVYLFIKILTSERRIFWFLFSFVLALNAFTDYLPNFIIIVFWIYAIFSGKNKYWWKKFIFSHTFLFTLFLLWMPYLTKQLKIGLSVKNEGSLWWGVLGRTDLKNLLLVPVKFVFGRISYFNKIFYFALSTFVLTIYSLIIYKGYKKVIYKKYYFLIALWFLVPVTLSAVVGLKISVFSYFRLIFVLPAFLIILSLSILNLSGRLRNISLIFVLLISILSSAYYLTTPRFQREDWRGLVSHIHKESEGLGYRVVFASNGQREAFNYYSITESVIIDNVDIEYDLDKLWYIRYVQDIFDPGDSVRKRIESMDYEIKNIHDFNGIIVWEYENSD